VRRVMVRFEVGADPGATKKLANTKFIVRGRFEPHAVRDGNLITGQQQYSAVGAAWLVIQARLCGRT
jgi:putative intracellular protease/amidase